MAAIQTLDSARVERFVITKDAAVVQSRSRTAGRVYSDLHPDVFKVFIGCWAAFIAMFWITFEPSAYAMYMLGVVTLYALAFFGLPVIMNRVGHFVPKQSGTLMDFLHGSVETIDGRVSGWEALIQVLLVPVCLTVGGLFISLIIDMDRVMPY